MVYGFAKQSGGHIRIYSEVGQGTTVKLYLPRASGTEDIEPEADMEAVSDLPVGDATILLVEDDRDVAVFATAVLAMLGYRFVAASNRPAALAVLDKVPHLHLRVTDVFLPGGRTGRTIAQALQEEPPA